MNTTIADSIRNGFTRRDSAYVTRVFKRFKDDTGRIPPDRLGEALRAAHVRNGTRVNGPGVDKSEFLRLVQRSDPIQRWLASLPLADVVADALAAAVAIAQQANPAQNAADVRIVTILNQQSVDQALDIASASLQRVVWESIQTLQTSYVELDRRHRQLHR